MQFVEDGGPVIRHCKVARPNGLRNGKDPREVVCRTLIENLDERSHGPVVIDREHDAFTRLIDRILLTEESATR